MSFSQVSERRSLDEVLAQLMDNHTEGQPSFLSTFDVTVVRDTLRRRPIF